MLAALARTVDASRPYAPIFARRELLTGRAQQSMRTFYRSMDDLETIGFITRPPQTRYGAAGLFGRAYIHLTPKAAALLGLVEHPSEGQKPSAPSREDAVKTERALSLAPPSVTVADGAIYKDLIPTTQKRQSGRLPADLHRLLSLGFREFLIFKLMREARLHEKLLSDVVEASWNHLRRAKHPISYLRTLLRAPVDFAYRVRSQRHARAEEQNQRTRTTQVDTAIAKLMGQSFLSRDGLRRYRVSDDARSIVIHHRDEAQPRVHAGAWASDFLAALEAGHIVSLNPDAPSGMQADSDRGASPTHASEIERPSEAHLNDLKALLRLKRANPAPTMKSREAARPSSQGQSTSLPLSSLLQTISRVASSTRPREIPELKS
ncbi:replication protein O [Caballeronia novacaledonica]|uniref:Replication protein O n=1 Tax=Caballeronia novacaledonica TaxID=1544861 RepID=A0AA37I8W3_9BURK|nr:replication protein O [Caballeronia novacaledonica]GJH24369.1 replication protein O [Caballeronia novacaledonica]